MPRTRNSVQKGSKGQSRKSRSRNRLNSNSSTTSERKRKTKVGKRKEKEGRVAPYQTNEDLPEKVRKSLPKHGEDIYREAFNHAFQQYQDPKKRRRRSDSPEQVSHRVAWNAVKKRYHKEGQGNWKEGGDE